MRSGRRHYHYALWLGLILCAYLALAGANSIIIPLFHWPDEIGHFFAIKYLADHWQLPPPEIEAARQYRYGQHGTHPPLYYVIGALLARMGGLEISGEYPFETAPRNPFTTCGSPPHQESGLLYGNGALWAARPFRWAGALPWTGYTLTAHLLRFLSVGLGIATTAGVYAIARLCVPSRPAVALLAAALTCLNPQFCFVSAQLTNDNLLVALCTWALYVILRIVTRGPTASLSALAGALIGLAALTKLTGLLLVVLAAGAIGWTVWSAHHRACSSPALVRKVLGYLILLAIPLVALSAWWYLRNWLLYGDPALIRHHLAIVRGRANGSFLAAAMDIPAGLQSYWASFVCNIAPGLWYAVFWDVVAVGGVLALAIRWRAARGRDGSTPALGVLGAWFALVFLGWVRWNDLATGVLGRLLFPATASVSVIVCAGWVALSTGWMRWLRVALPLSWFAAALWVLVALFYPAFGPPTRLASAEELHIDQRVDGVFGDSLVLLGYELRPTSVDPGGTVTVKLYLTCSRPLTVPYTMGLWFISAVPGESERLTGVDTWPGRGSYPTILWQPGEVIVDVYRLKVPRQVERTQAWMLQVSFSAPDGGQRLPLSTAGQQVGDRALLGWIRVRASQPQVAPPHARLEPSPVFGRTIALRGAEVNCAGDTLAVRLWWQALESPAATVSVFVHLVDQGGQLVATGDGPPLRGGFPTQMWKPGDWVEDTRVLLIPRSASLEAGAVRVGWYDPVSGTRLTTDQGADAVTLPQPVPADGCSASPGQAAQGVLE